MSEKEAQAHLNAIEVANRLAEWINAQPIVKDREGNPTIAPVYSAWVLLCEFIRREAPDPPLTPADQTPRIAPPAPEARDQ